MARPRPRKSAAALPKKPKLEKATSLAPSVAKDPTAGTTPDAAIDVEAEWEARYGWRVEEAVASTVGVQVDIVRNVVNMLSNDCTIPLHRALSSPRADWWPPGGWTAGHSGHLRQPSVSTPFLSTTFLKLVYTGEP
ncbi:hypothetical protein MTO96_046961 [Rhipicephalus appendiculatus]